MKDTKNTQAGIVFTDLLTIAFIVLKLCNIINWSWIWVLSPIWIPFALLIVAVITTVIVKMRGGDRK